MFKVRIEGESGYELVSGDSDKRFASDAAKEVGERIGFRFSSHKGERRGDAWRFPMMSEDRKRGAVAWVYPV